jgi:hypothetical protein
VPGAAEFISGTNSRCAQVASGSKSQGSGTHSALLARALASTILAARMAGLRGGSQLRISGAAPDHLTLAHACANLACRRPGARGLRSWSRHSSATGGSSCAALHATRSLRAPPMLTLTSKRQPPRCALLSPTPARRRVLLRRKLAQASDPLGKSRAPPRQSCRVGHLTL